MNAPLARSHPVRRWCCSLLAALLLAMPCFFFGCDQPPPEPEPKHWQQAQELADAGDNQAAIAELEKLFAVDPDQPEPWLLYAKLLTEEGVKEVQQGDDEASFEQLAKAAKAMRTFEELGGELDASEQQLLAATHFFEAIYLAKQDKPEDALVAIKQAYAAGLDDLGRIHGTPQLSSVRELPGYREFFEREVVALQERIGAELAAFEPFTLDFSLENLAGETIELTDFSGDIVLLDLWATWCAPCREMIPHLMDLDRRYKAGGPQGQGVSIIGIALEGTEKEQARQQVKIFADAVGIDYPLLLGNDEFAERVPNFRGLPTMLLIDRSGQVRQIFVGVTPELILELSIKALLAAQGADTQSNITAPRENQEPASQLPQGQPGG